MIKKNMPRNFEMTYIVVWNGWSKC